MRRVGEVVRVAQGLAILRTTETEFPELGTDLLDDSLETVGQVVDVFGPTDNPYVAVSPEETIHPPELVGSALYVRTDQADPRS